jgi:hypothetical protein
MKNKYLSICSLVLALSFTSCLNDDFLDRSPIDKETEETVFTTYENFKMYAWGFYIKDGDKTIGTLKGYENYPQSGDESDMMFDSNDPIGLGWANNIISPSNISASSWRFSYVRKVNIMLDQIEASEMNDKDQKHMRALGYFFRAHEYFELMKRFGALPWLEHTVSTGDTDILYAKQDSREVVANNILSNLLYAEEHINPKGDGANTVNTNVVRALISRFGLFEGTWRKYHGAVDNVDGTKYLEASAKASESLISQNLGLISNYDDVFNSLSLKGQKSILLYKEYLEKQDDMGHDLTQRARNERLWEGTKRLVEHYLCVDGKPISTSDEYDGDQTIYDEFRNRDLRLYYTICPPYKVIKDGNSWKHTDNPHEREYIDFMNDLVNGDKQRKLLPVTGKELIVQIPNLTSVKVPGVDTQAGYYMYKYYNDYPGAIDNNKQGTDAPVFRMGEVLVNYAEVMFELGKFNQTVADQTINELRKRANVAPMLVASIHSAFDKFRDTNVDPVLWEIRRERTVELMGSGYRFEDVKRWKKGDYLNLQPMGVKINNMDEYDNDETLTKSLYNGADQPRYKNCVTYTQVPTPGWHVKCYLYPIPLKQTVLNPNLDQSPKW